MPVFQTNHNQVFDQGRLVSEEVVEVDVTEDAVRLDIHAKARQALAANAAFLALASPTNAQTLAQVRRLTRECSGLVRLLLAVDGARDLLAENEDT